MSSSHRNSLNEFLSGLKLDCDTLIDCGGSQEKLPARVKKFNVKNYIILDLTEPHANSPKPDIAWDMNDLIDFNYANARGVYGRVKGAADIVTAFELTDYIYLPGNMMRNIAFMLKPGGISYVSYPSVYPLHQPIEDDALRYMPGGIKKLANYAGLEIVEVVKRRPETDLFEQFYRAERMRAAKHEDHRFTGLIVKFRKAET